MKSLMFGALAAASLAAGATAFAADDCDFDISGTWESAPAGADPTVPARYRFGADGLVTTLSRFDVGDRVEWREAAGAVTFFYRLDDPKSPSIIEFLGPDGSTRRGSMEISRYDEGSFTTLDANSDPTRWVRIEAERYFVAFVAQSGEIRTGGPAFAMLIRTDADGRSLFDAFGLYFAQDALIVGTIPAELRRKFMNESRLESDTMLRLELTSAEFERASKVLRTWDRRAREHKMLYEVPYLNNIVFLEQMAQSLNKCGDRIRVKKLGWNVGDEITARYNLPQIPFYYIRSLREMNEPLHLRDADLQKRMGSACAGNCRAPARVSELGRHDLPSRRP